jgi:hypothetical protein
VDLLRDGKACQEWFQRPVADYIGIEIQQRLGRRLHGMRIQAKTCHAPVQSIPGRFNRRYMQPVAEAARFQERTHEIHPVSGSQNKNIPLPAASLDERRDRELTGCGKSLERTLVAQFSMLHDRSWRHLISIQPYFTK